MIIQKLDELPIAINSRLHDTNTKLLVITRKTGRYEIKHSNLRDITKFLDQNDVIVVNDTSTIPSSFMVKNEIGQLFELRLMRKLKSDMFDIKEWVAYIYGKGGWREKTELRQKPPDLEIGQIIKFDSELEAEIKSINLQFNQLIRIQFLSSDLQFLWKKLYQLGKPIQYSYLKENLEIWDQQTIFSVHPVSVEPPSASFQFNWKLLNDLLKIGVTIIPVTHAINISSTGNIDLDYKMPFPERYWISEKSSKLLNQAIFDKKRIITLGTSATRAVEDNFSRFQKIKSGSYLTNLKITANYDRKVVEGLISGMHIPNMSHYELLSNFVPIEVLEQAYDEALNHGYLWHEYGDLTLIL